MRCGRALHGLGRYMEANDFFWKGFMNLTQGDSLEFTAKLLRYVAMTGREVARRGNVTIVAKNMLNNTVIWYVQFY